jgi:hypothetical protein
MIDILREICKPVLKQDFTAHGIIESPLEFGPWTEIIRRRKRFFDQISFQGAQV